MASRLRFSMTDDICLLREVLIANPYYDCSKWADIQAKVCEITQKSFSMRTVREHMQHLLHLWRKNDKANIRKSYTQKEYELKEQLLEKVAEIAEEYYTSKSNRNNERSVGPEFTLKNSKLNAVSTCTSSSLVSETNVNNDISLGLESENFALRNVPVIYTDVLTPSLQPLIPKGNSLVTESNKNNDSKGLESRNVALRNVPVIYTDVITPSSQSLVSKSSRNDERVMVLETKDFSLRNLKYTDIMTPSSSSTSVEAAAIETPEVPLETTTEVSTGVPSNQKMKAKQLRKEFLDVLQRENKEEKEWRDNNLQLERERLKIKRRKITLDEEKFKLEKEEKLHRIEMEKRHQALMEKVITILGNK